MSGAITAKRPTALCFQLEDYRSSPLESTPEADIRNVARLAQNQNSASRLHRPREKPTSWAAAVQFRSQGHG
jgi:hypothetical protein